MPTLLQTEKKGCFFSCGVSYHDQIDVNSLFLSKKKEKGIDGISFLFCSFDLFHQGAEHVHVSMVARTCSVSGCQDT